MLLLVVNSTLGNKVRAPIKLKLKLKLARILLLKSFNGRRKRTVFDAALFIATNALSWHLIILFGTQLRVVVKSCLRYAPTRTPQYAH